MTVTRDALFVEIGTLIEQHSIKSDISLSNETKLVELGVDSIDLMEIIFRLEEKHGVAIEPSGMKGRKTVGEVVDYAFQVIAA